MNCKIIFWEGQCFKSSLLFNVFPINYWIDCWTLGCTWKASSTVRQVNLEDGGPRDRNSQLCHLKEGRPGWESWEFQQEDIDPELIGTETIQREEEEATEGPLPQSKLCLSKIQGPICHIFVEHKGNGWILHSLCSFQRTLGPRYSQYLQGRGIYGSTLLPREYNEEVLTHSSMTQGFQKDT